VLAIGLESGGDPVTATRVWFETNASTSISPNTMVDSDDEEAGFLEQLADIEDGIESLGRALNTTTGIMAEIRGYFRESTEKIDSLEKTGGTSSAKLALANRLASLLEDSASRLEVSSGEFAQSIQRMEPGMKYLLRRLANEPDQLAQAPEFPGQVRQLIEATESTIPMTLGYKKTIEGVGTATRSLRRVTKRIATSFQLLSDSAARVASWKPLVDGLPNSRAA
jgi:septal ring factor EnvC (AmiA/AmiB activator)